MSEWGEPVLVRPWVIYMRIEGRDVQWSVLDGRVFLTEEEANVYAAMTRERWDRDGLVGELWVRQRP